MEELRTLLAPHYGLIKAVHVMSVAIWSSSTAVAWIYYLKPALIRARRKPQDEGLRAARDRMMEAFDRGAGIEHVAFVVLTLTAGLLLVVGGFDLSSFNYLSVMLWVGILVILPMEIVDIHLSHLGGNKERIRKGGDDAFYERKMAQHWVFFRITEPIIVIMMPTMFYLAVAKPF